MAAIHQKSKHRQAHLLAWILLFLVLFSITVLFIIMIFNPHHDPAKNQYTILISGLVVFCLFAYGLNYAGHYNLSASLLIAIAAATPWASLFFDPAILRGDIIPLVYVTFSVVLSSIFFPTYATFALAILQFTGITLVLVYSPIDASLNWTSLLAFIFLTGIFSILTNNIIQRDMKQIESQASLLASNEIRLQELSIRDHLTNLFNRRYLEETLEREIQRATRQQISLGIIIADVDKFKHINDTLGHAAGDIVLRELGRFIVEKIRRSDVACRYGGDEFVIILPEAPREVIEERAEQLRQGAKNLVLPVPITISLGTAVFPDNGTDGDTLLKFADVALYQAKKHRTIL
jgi:diguanylate cyclase (GGDEF)-like protein